MDAESKTFVIHMAIQEWEKMLVHFERHMQIKAQNGAKVGALILDKSSTAVLAKYFNYSNVFLAKYAVELQNTPEEIIMLLS